MHMETVHADSQKHSVGETGEPGGLQASDKRRRKKDKKEEALELKDEGNEAFKQVTGGAQMPQG